MRYASHHRRDRDVIKTILQHILTGVPVKEEKNDKEKKGENTMVKSSYTSFLQEIRGLIPQDRIYTDELRRLAWGTDAGFYRLIPQIVIRSNSEEEISDLLRLADRYGLPVTFRAAGTSLSGQAISDSILIVAGNIGRSTAFLPIMNRLPCNQASSVSGLTRFLPPTDVSLLRTRQA